MKRDPRLVALSVEHHHALVLARRLTRASEDGALDAAVVTALRSSFDRELTPHFEIEERVLLPALRLAGHGALCDRTMADHDALRGHLVAAEAGALARVTDFAARLTEHVRFEERELFPACEATLPADVLDAAARR